VSQSAFSEQIAELMKQAEETLRAGDPESARMIYEAILQIDSENRDAAAAIGQLGAAGAAPAALEVDFELAAASPSPAPRPLPPAPAPPAPSPEVTAEALEDLLEAADDLPVDERPAAGETKTAAARAAEGEAALLAEQARRLLYQGDVERATEIASRALAMHEGCESAQEILEEARAETDRRAATAERLLSEGIATIEHGDPHHAIGMLQQVLQLAPNHAEALEWLARARQLVQESHAKHGATAVETGPLTGPPTGIPTAPPGIASAPLQAPAPPPQVADFTFEPTALPSTPSAPATPAAPPAGRYADGVAKDRPAVDAPLATLGDARRSRAPIPVAGTEAAQAADTTAPTPPPPPPLPPPAGVPAPAARPLIGKAARAGRPPASRRLLLPLTLVLLLAVAGAGAWWLGPALGLWGGSTEAAVETVPTARPEPPKAASAPAAPKLTKADVPRLLVDAKLAIARGDEKTGYALIQQAATLDPAHKEAAQLNAKVQHALATRAEREDRMAHLASSYQNQDFGEVLRILYRLPKDEQPANLGGMIADASFNLGLQMMRTGDPYSAREYLRDTLERRPRDGEAKRLLDLIKKYRTRTRDEAYYEALSSIEYRPLEELAKSVQ